MSDIQWHTRMLRSHVSSSLVSMITSCVNIFSGHSPTGSVVYRTATPACGREDITGALSLVKAGVWPSLEKLRVRWEENTEVIKATGYRMVMRPFPRRRVWLSEALRLFLSRVSKGRPAEAGRSAAIDFPSAMHRFWRSMKHESICVLINAVCSADQCRLNVPAPKLGSAHNTRAWRGIRPVMVKYLNSWPGESRTKIDSIKNKCPPFKTLKNWECVSSWSLCRVP